MEAPLKSIKELKEQVDYSALNTAVESHIESFNTMGIHNSPNQDVSSLKLSQKKVLGLREAGKELSTLYNTNPEN